MAAWQLLGLESAVPLCQQLNCAAFVPPRFDAEFVCTSSKGNYLVKFGTLYSQAYASYQIGTGADYTDNLQCDVLCAPLGTPS